MSRKSQETKDPASFEASDDSKEVDLKKIAKGLGASARKLLALDLEEAEEHKYEHAGAFIRELRTRQGMTIARLAEQLGYSGPTVSRWELGTYELPSDRHFAFAVINALEPGEAERRQLFKLITGVETSGEEFDSEADRREAMLDVIGRMRHQAASIANQLEEYNKGLDFLESYLLEESIEQDDSTPEETTIDS